MKRTIIYRITAMTMALLIGLTSIGMTINMHFCGGSLRSISLLEGSDSCCSTTAMSCGNFEKLSEANAKKCCDNHSIEIQSDDDLIIDQVQVFSDINLLDALAVLTDNLEHSLTSIYDPADFQHYRPPLIPKDIPVLFESYLL